MPIYAYRCAHCGHTQDVLQKLSDPVLTVCPACGRTAYAKQVTAAGFQLKGSGWYVTDFRNDGKGGKKKSEGEGAEGADGKGGKGDKGDEGHKGAESADVKPAPGSADTPAAATKGEGAGRGDAAKAPAPAPAATSAPAAAPAPAPAKPGD